MKLKVCLCLSIILSISCIANRKNLQTERTERTEKNRQGLSLTEIPKKIYTFWDTGYEKMPTFHKENVNRLRKLAESKGYQVIVMDAVEGSPNNFYSLLNLQDVPEKINTLEKLDAHIRKVGDDGVHPGVLKADLARAMVIARGETTDGFKGGGIWLDATSFINPEFFASIDRYNLKTSHELFGYHLGHYGTNAFNGADGMENWFFAARSDSPMMRAWADEYVKYIVDFKKKGVPISQTGFLSSDLDNEKASQLAESVDRLGGFKDYLSQHASLKRAMVKDPSLAKKVYSEDAYPVLRSSFDFDFDHNKFKQIILNPHRLGNNPLSILEKLDQYKSAAFQKFTSSMLGKAENYGLNSPNELKAHPVFGYLLGTVSKEDFPDAIEKWEIKLTNDFVEGLTKNGAPPSYLQNIPVYLKSGNKYLSAYQEGGGESGTNRKINDADAPREWEEFTFVRNEDGNFFIKTRHGTYVTTSPDGSKGHTINRQAWEVFKAKNLGNGNIELIDFHKNPLRLNNGTNFRIKF